MTLVLPRLFSGSRNTVYVCPYVYECNSREAELAFSSILYPEKFVHSENHVRRGGIKGCLIRIWNLHATKLVPNFCAPAGYAGMFHLFI